MTNPYEAPPVRTPAQSIRPYVEAKSNFAKLSWKIPLAGTLVAIVIGFVARPIDFVGGIVFIGSIFVGLVVSLIGLKLSFSYSRVARHAVIGLLLNTLFAISVFAMFHAVASAREAETKARDAAVNALREAGIKAQQQAAAE